MGRRSTEEPGWFRDERILSSIDHVAQSPSRISLIINDASRTYPRGLCMQFNRYVSASWNAGRYLFDWGDNRSN